MILVVWKGLDSDHYRSLSQDLTDIPGEQFISAFAAFRGVEVSSIFLLGVTALNLNNRSKK